MLYNATTTFREHHFVVLDRIREEISKKVRTLKTLKEQQLKELDSIAARKKVLISSQERLEKLCQTVKTNQKDLAKRYN